MEERRINPTEVYVRVFWLSGKANEQTATKTGASSRESWSDSICSPASVSIATAQTGGTAERDKLAGAKQLCQ